MSGSESESARRAAGARRVLAGRLAGPGVSDADRPVHLLPLPHPGAAQPGDTRALCGIRMAPGELETVAPGDGAWCPMCYLAHVTGPAPASASAVGGRGPGVAGYRKLGWPVTVRDQEVTLHLDPLHAVALVIPTLLAVEATEILLGRRCAPAVLAHPALPSHRILLAGERFDVPLGWPTGVHRITGILPLPPTVTTDGPLLWTRTPQPHALKLCREVDVAAALRRV